MVKWDINHIYNFNDTEKLINELESKTEDFKKLRERLNESLGTEEFMVILKKKEKITEIASKLAAYAELWISENTADSKRNAHYAKISEVCADAGNETMFFTLWFKDLDEDVAKKFIRGSGKYHYLLDRIIAFKKYTLREKEEQIINLKDLTGNQASTRFYDIITNKFRFDYNGKKLSQEEMNQYKESLDRKERIAAYDLVLGRYGQEEDMLGEIYKTIVSDWKNENVKLRGFSSAITARNHGNDVPDAAVDALLKVVRKNSKLFQEYFKLKAKLCNLKNMDRYDLYTPFAKTKKKYSFEDCKKTTLETYKQFDEKAYLMAKKIFDDNHVHSDITDNKRSGAYCLSVLNSLSPYILLNHVGRLNDLFTMMHEFGHGIHSLAAKEQTNFTFQATLPMAETASIFGEMLLSQRLLKEGDTSEKISVLVKMLDGQYASIIRQGYFVMFEKDAHRKIADGATVDDLNRLYHENLKDQFGDSMKIPEVFKHEWKYIPHIYHTPFYCYAYSFGNLLVLALYKMYEKEGKSFVPKYLKILSYGGSESPAKILKEVGVDITKEEFWQQGFDIIREELTLLKKLISSAV